MLEQDPEMNEQQKKIPLDDDSLLIKTFISLHNQPWRQELQGILLIQENLRGETSFKVKAGSYANLSPEHQQTLEDSSQGSVWRLQTEEVTGVERPDQKFVYLTMSLESGEVIAFSFFDRQQCRQFYKAILERVASQNQFWTFKSIQQLVLPGQSSQSLVNASQSTILSHLRQPNQIEQFCQLVSKLQEHAGEEYDFLKKDPFLLGRMHQIIKFVLFMCSSSNIQELVADKSIFQSILKCLSFTQTFQKYFNYLDEYNKTKRLNNPLEIEDQDIIKSFDIISRIKFLKDVAMCTFIQIPQEAVLNYIVTEASFKIICRIVENTSIFAQFLKLAKTDYMGFLNTFIQVWQLFKSISTDFESVGIKEQFFTQWEQTGLFKQTFAAISRLTQNKQISDIPSLFWVNLRDSLNPMLSYDWSLSQTLMTSYFTQTKKINQSLDLMSSMLHIFAHCDDNTKLVILEFVRCLIEPSEFRKKINSRMSYYVYEAFIKHSFEYCDNPQNINNFLMFLEEIYLIDPKRTRHMIVETGLFSSLKKYTKNKHNLIMMIKLLRVFIEVEDDTLFSILSYDDPFEDFRKIYLRNRKSGNIIHSQFLLIFKEITSVKNKQIMRYVYKLLMDTQIDEEVTQENQKAPYHLQGEGQRRKQELYDHL